MPWISNTLANLIAADHLLIVRPDGIDLRFAQTIAQLIGVLESDCDRVPFALTFNVESAQQMNDGRTSPPLYVVRLHESDDWFSETRPVPLPVLRLDDRTLDQWLRITVTGEESLYMTIWWRTHLPALNVLEALVKTFLAQ
jgi:hypothetical protein